MRDTSSTILPSDSLPASWELTQPTSSGRPDNRVSAYFSEALRVANDLSFPQKKDENWRWVDFSGLNLDALHLLAGSDCSSAPENAGNTSKPGFQARVILQAGEGGVDLSSLLEKGIIFAPLGQVLAEKPALLEGRLGTIVPPSESKFAALASGLGRDGLVLYVPRDVQLEGVLSAKIMGGFAGMAHFTHALIWLEEGASCSLALRFEQAETHKSDAMHTGVVEIHLGEGAVLNLFESQDFGGSVWNITHERARLAKDARLTWFYAALGSRLSKNFLNADLDGEGAAAELKGAYISGQGRLLDLDTQQNHWAPRTTSNLLYKGAANGNGKAVWEGMIYVAPEAQLTDGYQANRNLVLGEQAVIKTIPGLEICADNVRCSHGATVGSLDPDELFYLRTRGIPLLEAEQILVEGFFTGILESLPSEDLKQELLARILRELAKNQSNFVY